MVSAHELDEAIIKTIILFDLVDYPLTALEIWEYCYHISERIAFGDFFVRMQLSTRVEQHIEHKQGFYYFKGRGSLVLMRSSRYRISIAKWKKARTLLRLLCFIPGVRAVALSSSLGYGNAIAQSDIDFFVITHEGTLWQTRVLSVLFAIICGRRPTARHKANAFCLSFFVNNNKDIGEVQLPTGDPLFGWWVSRILPIVERECSVRDFFVCNTWIQDMYPNALPPSCAPCMRMRPKFGLFSNSYIERGARWISKVFGSRVLWEMAKRRESVIMDNDVLKLHIRDTRKEYNKRFEEQWRAITSTIKV